MPLSISPHYIEQYIINNFEDVNPLDSWGEKSFFFNPNNQLKRGTYFATIKEKDGDNDKSSNLDRSDIFRFNMGVPKDVYLDYFEIIPKRPAKGCIIEGCYDFQKTNTLLPHPVYGWMGWMCVLNPDEHCYEKCKPLLEAAYNKAKKIAQKKL